MKKRTLTVVCLFLFFNLTLTSCDQKEVEKEIKNEESTPAEPSLDETLEVSETEEVVEDSSNKSEQIEIESEIEEIKPEDIQEVSYAFGHILVQQLSKEDIVLIDMPSFIRGIEAALAGEPAPLTEQEYEEKLNKLYDANLKCIAATNLIEAEDFLSNNKHNEGVVVLVDNKLQYKILQNGEGEEVSLDSVPRIYFKGTLLNGKEFGASDDHLGPVNLNMNRIVPGISQGMLGMKVGEKRVIYVHPELGYGITNNMVIPPNSLLIFEVEVYSILHSENQVSVNMDESVENSTESLKEEIS